MEAERRKVLFEHSEKTLADLEEEYKNLPPPSNPMEAAFALMNINMVRKAHADIAKKYNAWKQKNEKKIKNNL